MYSNSVVYFDVDGTLLDNKRHIVPKSTLDSLHLLKENGHRVALCTGRTPFGLKEAGVDKLFPWDGYVLSNGSTVFDKDFNLIREVFFDIEFIKELDTLNPGPLLCEGDYTFITKPINDRLQQALDHFHIPTQYEIETLKNQRVYNIISYDHHKIEAERLQHLTKSCIIAYDQLGNLELIPKHGGKHRGVAVLNDALNLPINKYIAFGDGENDLEFLSNAHLGIAMGNACDNAKNVADFITKDVDKDGIKHALEYFKLI